MVFKPEDTSLSRSGAHILSRSGKYLNLFRYPWRRFLLWEIRHPWWTLGLCLVIVTGLAWQAGKLQKRLRGGLVTLPGSESLHVLRVVEADFSKAVAYPTILVQEGLGEVAELEESWQQALGATRQVSSVKDVIDMHLGRKIVAHLMVNTRSWSAAEEMIKKLHAEGIPPDCKVVGAPKVNRDGQMSAVIETDVRSFKEGEQRRQLLERTIQRIKLPEGSTLTLEVTRHPLRNFALVEGRVNSYQEAEALTSGLQKALHEAKLATGNRVWVTGLPALFRDLNQEAVLTLRKAEWIGVPICFLLLVWVFGSPTAAILPVVVALVALATGSAVMTKVGKYVEISMFVPSVLSMIGLGVGVDYMLILLSRFRECLPKHDRVDEAIMEAMHLAAPTLFSSGFTVMIGFSALVATPVSLFRAMGIAGIVIVLSALVCIFILAPPLFKITRRFIIWKGPVETRPALWKKWTHFVVEYPRTCLVTGLTLMLLLAWPVLEIETATLNPDALPSKLDSVNGYHLCKTGFGAGWLMPALIVIEKPESVSEEAYIKHETRFIRQLRGMDSTFDAIGASDLSAAATSGFSVEIPHNFFISESGRHHLILAMYDGNPLSLNGRRWVEEIRGLAHSHWDTSPGYSAAVGGMVAATLDVDAAVGKYLVRTVIFCLVTTFVCFACYYRSIFIPLQSIIMNILSVMAAYGFLVLWFQKGWGSWMLPAVAGGGHGMNSVVILLLFCALFGLSMDYQVFLVSRMAEEWRHSHNNKLAVRHGIELTGRVVTGAAAVMIALFLSFAFVSVLETRQFGTGMAAAILFDSTIIRLFIFPSAMLLMGQLNWWWPFGKTRPPHPSSSHTLRPQPSG